MSPVTLMVWLVEGLFRLESPEREGDGRWPRALYPVPLELVGTKGPPAAIFSTLWVPGPTET